MKIQKKINELKEELKLTKNTIDQLNNRINELIDKSKPENEINLKKIQSLQDIINQKDQELNIEKNKNKILEDLVLLLVLILSFLHIFHLVFFLFLLQMLHLLY